MTVEDLIEELKQHPLTARVEAVVSVPVPYRKFTSGKEWRGYTPLKTGYDGGIVYIHLDE